jgi:hypothetical protein
VLLRQLQPPTAESHRQSQAVGLAKETLSMELVTLLDLGIGVNGYAGTAHGGFFNVVLDEVMGSAVNLLSGKILYHSSVLEI